MLNHLFGEKSITDRDCYGNFKLLFIRLYLFLLIIKIENCKKGFPVLIVFLNL